MERVNSMLLTYAEVISPSNETIKINLEQTEIKRASITGVVIPYSSEYKIDQNNDKCISFIGTIGAKVINNPNMIFNRIENKISSTKDIAFRRLNILK